MVSPHDDRSTNPKRRMHTTQPATLVVAVLAAAGCAWLGIDRFYGVLPRLPWLPPLTLVALAALEGLLARPVKAWVDRREGALPVDPLLVARSVVLAKASALAGALFGGLYLGMTLWLFVQRPVLVEADKDLPAAIAGIVASAALVLGSIVLERACRVPPSSPGDDSSSPGRPGSRPGGNG